ncbi:LamG domain-containing protein [Ferrimonas balearica]|uniref:LamG domain-containing protein n=1 Tax=Ferrimonas balearica TaxID=44012 RepID=UPI001F33D1FA|nr:LamG domain-containing protein [Ferrimonas balearica]MBY6093846.1 LamG domain-containing protein [Ferrimonas balearica]
MTARPVLDFYQSGSHVVIQSPNLADMANFVFEGWFWFDGTGHYTLFHATTDAGDKIIQLRVVDGELRFSGDPDDGGKWKEWKATSPLPTSQWIHLVAAYTPSGKGGNAAMDVWLNAQPLSGGGGMSNNDLPPQNLSGISIGLRYDNFDRPFSGQIARFSVWSKAVTQAHVNEWYSTAPYNLFDPTLRLYYEFDSGAGTTLPAEKGPTTNAVSTAWALSEVPTYPIGLTEVQDDTAYLLSAASGSVGDGFKIITDSFEQQGGVITSASGEPQSVPNGFAWVEGTEGSDSQGHKVSEASYEISAPAHVNIDYRAFNPSKSYDLAVAQNHTHCLKGEYGLGNIDVHHMDGEAQRELRQNPPTGLPILMVLQ